MVIYGRNKVNLGDIVVYQSNTHAYPIIHRVVKIQNNQFITKGDNNNSPDPQPVTQTLGKAVFKIPWLGWVKIIVVEPFTRGGN